MIEMKKNRKDRDMAPSTSEKRTEDWEIEEHIERLKNIPDVDCAASPVMSQALIFFGRQICDIKKDIADVPTHVIEAMNANAPKATPKVTPKGIAAAFGVTTTGGGTIGFLLFLVGKSQGWW